jgi:hypothetical protein
MLFFLYVFFFGAGIEPRASHMLGKHCTTELHPSPTNALEVSISLDTPLLIPREGAATPRRKVSGSGLPVAQVGLSFLSLQRGGALGSPQPLG